MEGFLKWILILVVFISAPACKESGVDDFFGVDDGGSDGGKIIEDGDDDFGVGNSALKFTPNNYDFGLVALGEQSPVKNFTLKNLASDPVYIQSVGTGWNPNYTVVGHNCPLAPASLASGASCDYQVKFNPQSGGRLDYGMVVVFGANSGDDSFFAPCAIMGKGVSPVVFEGVDSVSNIRSTSVRLSWNNADYENGYLYLYRDVDADGPFQLAGTLGPNITSVTITGLSPDTNYEFRVRAMDLFGLQDSNTKLVSAKTLQLPVLTNVSNRIFLDASGAIDVGTTWNVDVNNTANGSVSDTNMYYTCTYDQVVDGSVSSGDSCGDIAGFTLDAGFSGTLNSTDGNGQFSWTPPQSLAGENFEIRLTGNDGSVEVERIFIADIRSLYKKDSSLVVDLQASYAKSGFFGVNSPLTTIWENLNILTGSLYNALLSGNFATGWGKEEVSYTDYNPHYLKFDGVSGANASRMNLGTNLNSLTQMMLTGWVKADDLSVGSSAHHIFGSGGGSAAGWSLQQDADGRINLTVGQAADYEQVILNQSPAVYYRLEESAGTVAVDSSGNGHNSNFVNSANISMAQTGAHDNSYNFSSTGQLRPSPVIDLSVNGGRWTVSTWVKFPLPADSKSKVLVGAQQYNNHVLFDSNHLLGRYYYWGGGFSSSGFDADTLSAGWHHIAAVSDGSNMTYYVDGALVGSTSGTVGNGATNQHGIYAIGNAGAGTTPIHDMDEVAIFTTDLTAAQIREQYAKVAGCWTTITEDTWQHLGATYDGSEAKLFVNGDKKCEYTPTNGLTGGSDSFMAGAQADGSEAWQGSISALKVYDSGSESDVATNYNATKSNFSLRNCKEILAAGYTTSGVYTVSLGGGVGEFQVYCDMDTDGGGWTLIGKGREGWTWDNAGQGTISDLASAPEGTGVAALPQTHVQAILDSLGKNVSQLTDGMRIRRQIDASTWQEIRWNFTSQVSWDWAFDTGAMPLTVTLDGINYGAASGTTAQHLTGGEEDHRRLFTTAWYGQNYVKGFAYGNGVGCAAPYWCYAAWMNHPLPMAQVFVRD